MSKDPAVLFYTSDFISGTLTMTDAQRGKYILLLCLQHQQGYLTEEDMLNICKTYDEKIFRKFMKNGDGRYYNERMKLESEKRQKYSESRRNNRKNICKTYDSTHDESYDNHMENENISVDKGGVGENEKQPKEKIPIEVKHFEFYAKEAHKAKEYSDQMSKDYVNLCNHICQKNNDGSWRLPYVLKIKNQLTLDEFSKLYKKAGKNLNSIITKIDSLQTNVKYHGKYTDLYLTINNWFNRDNN